MIREPIHIEKQYYQLSDNIYQVLVDNQLLKESKIVIGICGESGSGKTVTATCLKDTLNKHGIKTEILHMDSFFYLPPKDNHLKRKEDIRWVGVQEVNIKQLTDCITQFKENKPKIQVPVVDYLNNRFTKEDLILEGLNVIIIEGVYTLQVEKVDFKIFLEPTYKDTLQIRKKRSREIYDIFVEQVLEIEHQLALQQKSKADLLIDKEYRIRQS
jgi:uridine kinase